MNFIGAILVSLGAAFANTAQINPLHSTLTQKEISIVGFQIKTQIDLIRAYEIIETKARDIQDTIDDHQNELIILKHLSKKEASKEVLAVYDERTHFSRRVVGENIRKKDRIDHFKQAVLVRHSNLLQQFTSRKLDEVLADLYPGNTNLQMENRETVARLHRINRREHARKRTNETTLQRRLAGTRNAFEEVFGSLLKD